MHPNELNTIQHFAWFDANIAKEVEQEEKEERELTLQELEKKAVSDYKSKNGDRHTQICINTIEDVLNDY